MLKGAAAMDQQWILHSSSIIGAAVAIILRCGLTGSRAEVWTHCTSPVEITTWA